MTYDLGGHLMSIEKRKNRWREFYKLGSGTNTLVLIDYLYPERPWPYPENMEKRLNWASQSYQFQLSNMEWLNDDRIPALNPYTGTELFAEAYGCKVHYSGDNMPFACPRIFSASEVGTIKPPRIFDSCLGDIFELGRRLRQRNGSDTILHIPDIQSPLDIAALIWDKADLFTAMLEDPPAVFALTEMIENTLVDFLDAWFKEFGTEFISHYPDYYMDGGITVSEDEIGSFGTAMFEEFCLGALNRLSLRYGGIGVHCCANAKHQWEGLKMISGLRMLNFVQPPDKTIEAYQSFADTTPMMHFWCGDGLPSLEWIENYPKNAHIVLNGFAANRDDAYEMCQAMKSIEEARKQ